MFTSCEGTKESSRLLKISLINFPKLKFHFVVLSLHTGCFRSHKSMQSKTSCTTYQSRNQKVWAIFLLLFFKQYFCYSSVTHLVSVFFSWNCDEYCHMTRIWYRKKKFPQNTTCLRDKYQLVTIIVPIIS